MREVVPEKMALGAAEEVVTVSGAEAATMEMVQGEASLVDLQVYPVVNGEEERGYLTVDFEEEEVVGEGTEDARRWFGLEHGSM